MNFFAFTWNTHGASTLPNPPPAAMSSDMLIIALQECPGHPKFQMNFPEHRFYAEEELGGLRTIVLSRKEFTVKTKKVGLGPFHFINKGFIAMCINDKVLHINAHLAAHADRQRERMAQILTIFESSYRKRFSTVILSGDLNFRMENRCDQGLEFLQAYDAFREDEITFQPTFKYKKNTVNMERTPSFCDRIFVASRRSLRFLVYSSMHHVLSSDHKPVYCQFEISGSEGGGDLLDVRPRNTRARELLTFVYKKVCKNHVSVTISMLGFLGLGLYRLV